MHIDLVYGLGLTGLIMSNIILAFMCALIIEEYIERKGETDE